ncbi:MAG TPA: hypothetical protein VKM94_06270 [Blastocatellia bacterium]|nr:hypothetical protein [Blastocatellia bacterium]
MPSKQTVSADSKGEFTINSLTAGLYRIDTNLRGEDLFVRSISLEPSASGSKGFDIAWAGISLKVGEQVKGVIVTLSQGAATVKGRLVVDEKQKPPVNKMRVYLVPSEKDTADDVLRYAEAGVEGDGSFVMTHLAPGQYWILVREVVEQDRSGKEHAPLAWESGGRMSLRFEGEALKKTLDLAPCQRLSDYAVTYVPLTAPSKPAKQPPKKPSSTSSQPR